MPLFGINRNHLSAAAALCYPSFFKNWVLLLCAHSGPSTLFAYLAWACSTCMDLGRTLHYSGQVSTVRCKVQLSVLITDMLLSIIKQSTWPTPHPPPRKLMTGNQVAGRIRNLKSLQSLVQNALAHCVEVESVFVPLRRTHGHGHQVGRLIGPCVAVVGAGPDKAGMRMVGALRAARAQ